jgi:hypothetical protein
MPKQPTTYAEKIRVWHVPQFPGKPFYVDVDDVNEAVKIVDVLANYDLFQLENKIKPDYSNASGIEYWDPREDEWFEVDEIEDLLNEHMGRVPLGW